MRRLAAVAALTALIGLAACSTLMPTAVDTLEPSETVDSGPQNMPSAAPSVSPSPEPSATATASPTVEPTPDLSWIQEAPLSEVEYRLPLTIRHLTDRVAVLQFALAEEIPAELFLWRSEDQRDLRQFQAVQGAGVFVIENLEPGVQYHGQVLISGETPSQPALFGADWPTVTFRTMDYENGGLTAAVLGDSGFGDQATRDLSQQIASFQPNFVLHTGDIVYRVDENPDPPAAFKRKLYQTHQSILVSAPFYAVSGNHEFDFPARWRGSPYYFEAFPVVEAAGLEYPPASDGSWYAVAHNDIQFIFLNTQSIFGQPGEAEQRAWLSERVADESFRYSVVVLHIPPFSLGRHQTSSHIIQARWGDLLIHERVPLVLAGHDHNYQRWQVESTTVVVSGGGSAVLYGLAGGHPSYQQGASVSHFVLAEFNQDDITLRALDRQGQVIDETQIRTQ